VSPRSYRRLFFLLPSRFRDEYGQELGEVVEDRWRVVQERGGIATKMRFWVRETVALTRLALRLRLGLEPDGAQPRGMWRKTKRRWEVNGWGQDVRQATRSLLKQPGFTTVTVLTLGLGIGASTAIFSAVHAVLFRDLAYADADRIVAVFQTDTETGEIRPGASAANLRDLDESSDRLSGAAIAEPWSLDLFHEDRAESLRTWAVSAGFFDILGADLALGRAFLPDEYVDGNNRVVVLGHRGWSQHFGADPSVVGRVFTLDNEPYTVIGVLPLDFKYPDQAAAWIPRPPKSGDDPSRAADYMFGVARLADGATLADAQAYLAAIDPETVKFYRNVQLTLDIFYPALITISLFLGIYLMLPARFGAWRWAIAALPLPIAPFDYLENNLIGVMLASGPEMISAELVNTASRCTDLKSSFTTASMLLLVALSVWWLVRRIQSRAGA